ncbi:MAG: CARDB domain-containing protein [Acidobacteriota bacterium]
MLTSVTTNMLSSGAAQSFTVDVAIPADSPIGAVFIGVIADSGSNIAESQEGNNIAMLRITTVARPDLTVRNLQVSSTTVKLGDRVRVSFSILNQGNTFALSHMQEIRLSNDNTIGTDDLLLTSLTSGPISGGATEQFVVDISLPTNLTPGSFFLGVITDARSSLVESNEINNTASVNIMITGQADFDITELLVTPAIGAPGAQVALNFKLNNRGTLAAPANTVEVRFSNNPTIDNNSQLLGTVNANAINAGQSITLSFNAAIPKGIALGRYFIGVVADARTAVVESNESNNIATVTFDVADQGVPQVNVQSPNGNEMIIAGETFTIKWIASDDVDVVTQDIMLSTDGGANFGQVIASGLAGSINSFSWNVPANLNVNTARIQIQARDGIGKVGNDSSDGNFVIGPRPLLIQPTFNSGKLTFLVSGSNLSPGNTLIVVNGSNRESFSTSLNDSGTKFIVKKSTTSSPSGLLLRKAIPKGVVVQLIVRNSNGIESTPISFQRP